jgi:glycosyltransferase involved in cell wall biosynthesis
VSSPRVTVVVPCFNYGRYLTDAVESVLAQTYRDFELLIVNDGSTDDSKQVAERLIAAHPDAPIRLIDQPNSGQPAYPRNNGIGEARGEYVLCLDADDRISENFLELTVPVLDARPRVAIAYPDQQNFDGDDRFEPHPPFRRELLPRFNYIPPASLFRRAVWEEVGGFRTNVRGYEDWNFWLSCIQAGHEAQHVPQALWHYRIHEGSLYGTEKGRDQTLKANTVLNHPGLYGQEEQAWARGVLAGDPAALAVNPGLGIVPLLSAPADVANDGSKRLHVVFTMYGWADEGGGTILPRQIAKALVRRGHRVTVISTPPRPAPGKPAYWVEALEDEGVRVFEIFNRPSVFNDPDRPEREIDDRQMRALVDHMLRELRPDVVHYHSFLGFSMRLAEDVDRADIPSVYTSHNYWPICPRMYLFGPDLSPCGAVDGRCDCVPARPAYERRLEQGRTMLGEHVDRHLAVSHRVRELFAANGHDESRIEVLQQQPETVDWIWREVGAAREPAATLDRPLRIGYIGSVLPHKGVQVLAAAAQQLPADLVEVHVFGGGPDSFVDVLRAGDANGVLRFRGGYETSELPEVLRELDLVVVPSVWEDCAPLVVAEALAGRLPVVASRMGGIPDFVDEGRTGFLVEQRDPSALAAALRRFLDDPELLGRMQAAIEAPKGFDAYLDELDAHYRRVIAERAARPRPSSLEGARSFAALAFADELVADQELLASYGNAFAGSDDATLVIYAAGGVTQDLLDVVAEAGLEGDNAPDLLAIEGAGTSLDQGKLAAGVHVVFSRRDADAAFAALPTVAEAGQVRELAERMWSALRRAA